jgi:hypothetical protein
VVNCLLPKKINYWHTIGNIYSVVEGVLAFGLEHIMDSNHTRRTRQKEQSFQGNGIIYWYGKLTWNPVIAVEIYPEN